MARERRRATLFQVVAKGHLVEPDQQQGPLLNGTIDQSSSKASGRHHNR